MCLLSIIVPNYNKAEYLAAALRSVYSIGISDFECIIIDDASTDNSIKIINEFIKSDSRFRAIKLHKNVGVSNSRNVGLGAMRGDFLIFLDSDDYLLPNGVARMLKIALENDADIVGGRILYGDMGRTENHTPRIRIYDDYRHDFVKSLYENNADLAFITRRLFRRRILCDVRFVPDLNWAEDSIFILDIMPNAHTFIETDIPMYFYNMVPGSLTHSRFSSRDFEFLARMLRHLHDETFADAKYDHKTKKWIYQKLYDLIYDRIIRQSLVHPQFRPRISRILNDIYGTEIMPRKYFTFRQRLGVFLVSRV
jgi:glycosyltransferase involved in cell wall biosynthesis